MSKGFRDFIMRGNVLDLAVAVVIGAAFGAIISSFVADILMPPIGVLLGNVSFTNLFLVIRNGKLAPPPYDTLAAAQAAGAATWNYGVFINTIISFLIIALAVFFVVRMFTRVLNAQKKQQAAAVTTKDCPFCATSIPAKATRCPNCTSELK
jgi:large conductance mechanosensitive channel